jgi:ferric iron reductase protein FhuF
MTDAVALIDTITRAVDYLRVHVAPEYEREGEWLECEPLVRDPAHLRAVVRATREGRGTDRADVAMSLFVQGYAFRIASLAVGGWVLGDAVIDIAPARTSIALGRHRPNAVLLDRAQLVAAPAGVTELHGELIERHLAPLVATARNACRVGAKLLWGNIAASCAASFGAYSMALPDRAHDIRLRAEAFFTTARREVRSGGHIVAAGDRWLWQRKTCCLWYLTESAFKCEDCSLWSDDERRARYAALAANEAP